MIKSRRMRWVGHVARMGKKGNMYRLLAGKPEHRCVDNIKMDLGEIGWGGVDSIVLTPDRDK
jgi:hypothetical protein